MTKHATYDIGRQIDALTRLRKRSRRGRSEIAVDLGMETDTYRRYENGQTEMRVSQIEALADAYRVTPAVLLLELGFDVCPWTPRVAMETAGLDAARIDQVETTVIDRPLVEQKMLVNRAIREHRETEEDQERHRSAS